MSQKFSRNQFKTISRPEYIFRARNHRIILGSSTCIMGIVNVTDNSFSNDGLLKNKKISLATLKKKIDACINEGADIIDIGGESSKPGSTPISVSEEIARVLPAVTYAAKKKIVVSIDTAKAEVAEEALKAGASIINTIKGTPPDKDILAVVKKYNAGLILMHMRGNPTTMQQNIAFKNVVQEIKKELQNSLKKCLVFGLSLDRIIVDPGIGFGKTPDQNLEILNHLKNFQSLKVPILVGTSRKSFIGKIINKEVEDRLSGSLGTLAVSILHGAHIVRVHDIVESKDVALVLDNIIRV